MAQVLTALRANACTEAIEKLSKEVDPARFIETFGDEVANLDALVAAKTVTLSKLMEIAPAGVVDPTPLLYDTTMYSMAGLLGIAFVANSQVGPVDKSLWMIEEDARAVNIAERNAKTIKVE